MILKKKKVKYSNITIPITNIQSLHFLKKTSHKQILSQTPTINTALLNTR